MKFRCLIFGSRDFDDYMMLELNCNHILKNKFRAIEIVSGGARGADTLAERYADNYHLDIKVFKPEWDLYGKSAGYKRNIEMAEYILQFGIDNCGAIGYHNGSKGSLHMEQICRGKNIPIRIVRF